MTHEPSLTPPEPRSVGEQPGCDHHALSGISEATAGSPRCRSSAAFAEATQAYKAWTLKSLKCQYSSKRASKIGN